VAVCGKEHLEIEPLLCGHPRVSLCVDAVLHLSDLCGRPLRLCRLVLVEAPLNKGVDRLASRRG
jgi:hypothetical protein